MAQVYAASTLMAQANVAAPKNPIMYRSKTGVFIDPIRFVEKDSKYIGNIDVKTLITEPFKFHSAEHGDHVRHTIKPKDAKVASVLLPPMIGTQVALGPEGNYDPSGTRFKQGSKDKFKAKFSVMGVPSPFDPKVDDGKGVSVHFRTLLKWHEDLSEWSVNHIINNPSVIPSKVAKACRKDGVSPEKTREKLMEGSTGLVHESVDEEATKSYPPNRENLALHQAPEKMFYKKGAYYVGLNQDVYYSEALGSDGKPMTKKRKTGDDQTSGGKHRRDPPVFKLVLTARPDGTYAYVQVQMTPTEVQYNVRDNDVFIPEVSMAVSPDASAPKYPTKPISIVTKLVRLIWLGPGSLSGARTNGVSCVVDEEELAELKQQAEEERGLIAKLSSADTEMLDACEAKFTTPVKAAKTPVPIPEVTMTEEEKAAVATMEEAPAPESPLILSGRLKPGAVPMDEDSSDSTQSPESPRTQPAGAKRKLIPEADDEVEVEA